MAEVYRSVDGIPIEKFMAKNAMTQAALRRHAETSMVRANRLVGEHRWHGDSHVTAERANAIDWSVTLHDKGNARWPAAGAMSIEYGREPGTNSPWGPMKGLYILHRAVGAEYAKRGAGRVKIKGRRGRRGFTRYV